jgi:hypothetical protein
VSRDTNGNVVVKMDAETQKRIGLKIEALTPFHRAPELKSYGRVLDPAALSALLVELATDQAAYVASSNELARLKMLAATSNATVRAVQTAEAAALRDQLAMQSARDRLQLSWGAPIAGQTDLPAFIQSLSALEIVLLRLDLPAGERAGASPTGARITPLAGEPAEAQFLGAALSVDPQTQGQGFIFQISSNQNRFLPGQAVTGWLKMPGEPVAGVIIPREAIVRTEGNAWVYVAGSAENFTRRPITLEQPADNGWFLTNGLSAGESVVTVGAQSLLSQETATGEAPTAD